jgi:hypothetical protein
MSEPEATSSSTWWKAWIAAVVGTPLLIVAAFIVGATINEGAGVLTGGLALAIWIFHGRASWLLADAIVSGRVAAGRPGGGTAGLFFGLLVGGWAAMFAVLFCGCLVAVSVG